MTTCDCSSHSLTSDVDIKMTAHAAELFLSDGVIVTGSSTGMATDLRELAGKFVLRLVNLLFNR
jgi:predicted TIM-barrel enzyme